MPNRAAPNRTRASLPWLWTLPALLVWAACGTPGLPPAKPASVVASHTIQQAQTLYLHPDEVDSRMLVGAMEVLESTFGPVRFEPGEKSGTLWVGDASVVVPLSDDLDPDEFRDELGQVLEFVRLELGDEAINEGLPPTMDLELLALNGSLQSLDRYSTIFSGRRTEDFQIRFSGKLHGIGSRIGRRDGDLTAVHVFPGSPAENGGLLDGDAIIQIDGEQTRPLSVGAAVERIRGEAGTEVVLTVLREGETFDVHIIRGEVVVPSVEAKMLENGVGYARIFQVSRETPNEFREKVEALGDIEGLVLDLRGNSGGSMLASAGLADFFVDEDTIVNVVGANGHPAGGVRNRAIATSDVRFPFPVAVLVDGSTASAAEILAGAIVPLPRVTMIGQTTFGKGVVQRVLAIPDENLLKLTVAEYRLSGDRAIHKKGLIPDIVLYPVSSEEISRLADVPEDAIPYLRSPGEDDTFPVDLGARVVSRGRFNAVREMGKNTTTEIEERLAPLDIEWPGSQDGIPAEIPEPFVVRADPLELTAGTDATLNVHVTNPNTFAVDSAWVALRSALEFPEGGVRNLGRLEPGSTLSIEVPVHVRFGLAVRDVPVMAYVASGRRPLHNERLLIPVLSPQPHLRIEVTRLGEDSVEVALENVGDADTGTIHAHVPSSSHTVESLPPGVRETFDLPLSGETDTVLLSLSGAGVQRAISVPLPKDTILTVPPDLEVDDQHGWRGRELRVRATAPDGLRNGWIQVDGEKKVYQSWDGSASADLRVPLHDGDVQISARIESVSGVSVMDSRLLTAE